MIFGIIDKACSYREVQALLALGVPQCYAKMIIQLIGITENLLMDISMEVKTKKKRSDW